MNKASYRWQRLDLGVLEEDAVVGPLLLLESAEELVEVVEGRLDRLLLRRLQSQLAVLQGVNSNESQQTFHLGFSIEYC